MQAAVAGGSPSKKVKGNKTRSKQHEKDPFGLDEIEEASSPTAGGGGAGSPGKEHEDDDAYEESAAYFKGAGHNGGRNYDNSDVIRESIDRITAVYPKTSQNSRLKFLDLSGLRLFDDNVAHLLSGLFNKDAQSN